MKKYIAPNISVVELKLEERISECTGSCTTEEATSYNNKYPNATPMVAFSLGS